MIFYWGVSHQSDDNARKWEATLTRPVPGSPDRMSAEDEMAQLNNL